MEKKQHIFGTYWTMYYGCPKFSILGTDIRQCLIVQGDGYQYHGAHFWGQDDWFMFPS